MATKCNASQESLYWTNPNIAGLSAKFIHEGFAKLEPRWERETTRCRPHVSNHCSVWLFKPNVFSVCHWLDLNDQTLKESIMNFFRVERETVYPLKLCSSGICRGLASVIRCRCGSRSWNAKAQNSHINWVIPEVHRGICGEILHSWECVHTWDKPPPHGFSILSPAGNGTVRLNNLVKAGERRLKHPYALKGNLATLSHFSKCGWFPHWLPGGTKIKQFGFLPTWKM